MEPVLGTALSLREPGELVEGVAWIFKDPPPTSRQFLSTLGCPPPGVQDLCFSIELAGDSQLVTLLPQNCTKRRILV